MRPPPTWNECRRKHIRRVEPDPERAASLVAVAKDRLEKIAMSGLPDEKASSYIEDYYETIKELLTAMMLRQGFRSENHQCLIAWFKETHPALESEWDLLLQLCHRRNRLQYYGEKIEPAFYSVNKSRIKELVELLLDG